MSNLQLTKDKLCLPYVVKDMFFIYLTMYAIEAGQTAAEADETEDR